MNEKIEAMRSELVHDKTSIQRVRDILANSRIEDETERAKVDAYLAGYMDSIEDVLRLIDRTMLS